MISDKMPEIRNLDFIILGYFFSYSKPYLKDSETGRADMLHKDAILCSHAAHTIRISKFVIL